jgi:hypothetical protein
MKGKDNALFYIKNKSISYWFIDILLTFFIDHFKYRYLLSVVKYKIFITFCDSVKIVLHGRAYILMWRIFIM